MNKTEYIMLGVRHDVFISYTKCPMAELEDGSLNDKIVQDLMNLAIQPIFIVCLN